MKAILKGLFIGLMILPGILNGQEPVSNTLGLVKGANDLVGTDGYPGNHYLVQNGDDGFYWIGSSSNDNVNNPMLKEVVNDFEYLYFIEYDNEGKAQYTNHVRGASNFRYAGSFNGGLTLCGYAYNDISAGAITIYQDTAYRLEFLAKFNAAGQLDNMISLWDLGPTQYVLSNAMMNEDDGSMYVFGTYDQPLLLRGHGLIGEEWVDYFYVIRYDRNLELTGVFTAGFDEPGGNVYGGYSGLALVPYTDGSVLITGLYNGTKTPLIGDEALPLSGDFEGTFAVMLGPDLRKEWVLDGNLDGYTSGYGSSSITEGFSTPDGGAVLVGTTSSGAFRLGEIDLEFTNGAYLENHFAAKISGQGKLVWQLPLATMTDSYYSGKKGTDSDAFAYNLQLDAVQWKDKVLYMTGLFNSDVFSVAGRVLEKPYYQGLYLMAVDMTTGEALWGYSVSSSSLNLDGFDVDGSGNPSVLGFSSTEKSYEGADPDVSPAYETVFAFGLDYEGKLIWRNNAFLEGINYGTRGIDLEVLYGGQVYCSIQQGTTGTLSIGGTLIANADAYGSHLVNLVAANSLGGIVQTQDGTAVYPASVLAYKICPLGAYPMVDSVPVDENGRYSLDAMYPGNYTLYAVPDREAFPNALPTYVGGGKAWDEARYHLLEADTKFSSLYITLAEMPTLNPEDGDGNLSGNVSFLDSPLAKSTVGKPVARTPVLLKGKKSEQKSTLAEDELIAYVETDAEGNYSISYVPDGDYYLHVDMPGLPMVSTYDVTILGNQFVGGLDFFVNPEYISNHSWPMGGQIKPAEVISLYPNPGDGRIFLDLPGSGRTDCLVFDASGALRHHEVLEASEQAILDLSHLEAGLYLLKLESEQHNAMVRYIKQ